MINTKSIKVGSPVVYPIASEQEGRYWISGSFRIFVEDGVWPTNYASVSSTDRRVNKKEIVIKLGDIYQVPQQALSEEMERAYLQEELLRTPDWSGKQIDIEEILDSWGTIRSNYQV